MLAVRDSTYGGEAVSTWYGDDDYAAQADLSFVSGNRVALLVRYIDPDNFMGVELRDNGTVNLIKMVDGRQTTVASGSYSGSSPYTTYVRCSGSSYVVRVEGTQVISTTDADVAYGTVALWAERSGKFEAVKAGVDSASDGDLDDAAVLQAPAMERGLADFQLLADLGDALARRQLRVRFPELANHLLRRMPLPLHRKSFLVAPRPVRLSYRLDQEKGSRSAPKTVGTHFSV